MTRSGIYSITNTVTGHQYIGSAINLSKRKREHMAALRRGDHGNVPLRRAWWKHGEDCFRFSALLLCNASNLLFYEQRAIDVFQPIYNICKVAGSRLGARYSEEAKRRLSEQRRSAPRTDAQLRHLRSLADSARGTVRGPMSADVKRKISSSTAGKRLSQEHVAKIAAASKGRLHSEEAKAKISAALRGRKKPPLSDAHRAAISARHSGRKHSPDSIERMRQAALRRSPELLARILAARLAAMAVKKESKQ